MRLLKADSQGELSLTKNLRRDIPSYAILSHTWSTEEEDEVSMTDLKNGAGKSKVGYAKIEFCRKQARKDGLQYFWVDTCSIDKTNQVELTEAIISMFRWYRHAAKCYVYLSDVSFKDAWESDLRKSRWFTRGWTLQELLAPRSVDFFSREGKWLGNKTTLERQLHGITDIPIMALRGVPVSKFSVDDRIRWAEKRNTTVPEDKAYCLQGILGIFMSPKYGEGKHAFVRLHDKINKRLGKRVDVDKLLSVQRPDLIRHVSFDQIPEFAGRNDEMDHLKMQILGPKSHGILSVFGPAGTGKSFLALKLAHQLLTKHPEQLIFWVEATDELTFKRDILELGKRLSIPGIADNKADVKTLVKQQLTNSVKDRWLLILDNANDEAIWGRRSSPTDQKPTLVNWLPISRNNFVLVTTRSRQVANHLAGKQVVELPRMTFDQVMCTFGDILEKFEVERRALEKTSDGRGRPNRLDGGGRPNRLDGRGRPNRLDGANKEPCPTAKATQGQHITATPDFTKDKHDQFYARPPNTWKSYWKVGLVFAILLHLEDTDTHRSELSCTVRGMKILRHILRMIVIKVNHGFCLAIPISTYNGQATNKPGLSEVNRQAHAIIYMTGTQPTLLPGELPPLQKRPIKVDPIDNQTLDKASRVDFTRIHTVEYNVRTMAIGLVSEDSMVYLIRYSREHMGR